MPNLIADCFAKMLAAKQHWRSLWPLGFGLLALASGTAAVGWEVLAEGHQL